MDIINGERAIMNTNHKIKFLLENVSDLDFNIDDAEISYLINGKTNDSYLLDFKKFKLVLRLNNKNSLNLGINRQNESLILLSLDKKNIVPNLVYMDNTYEFIIYEYIEGIELDLRKTDTEDRNKLLSLIESYQDIKIDLPKFNYFNHVSLYWKKIKEIKYISDSRENKMEAFLANLSDFQKSNWPTLLTHHDLKENILVTDNGYKIIDWEYAGNGFHDFDRYSLGLIEENEMIDDLIMVLNELWTEINYQN